MRNTESNEGLEYYKENNLKQEDRKERDGLTGKKSMRGMTVTEDLELFGSLSDGPLALLELLRCFWTRLPGQNVLQLHIQLLLFLGGETEKKEGRKKTI